MLRDAISARRRRRYMRSDMARAARRYDAILYICEHRRYAGAERDSARDAMARAEILHDMLSWRCFAACR